MHNGFSDSSAAADDGTSPLYHRPLTLDETLHRLADGGSTVIAGCTLYYLDGRSRPLADRLIDITGVTELNGIGMAADHVRIGALTTWSTLANASLPVECAPLQQAAQRVGALQIQNVGTLGGNLCGAAANADGIPPLLVADAEVELRSTRHVRTLPLVTFLRGNRQTAREPDELLTAVIVPRRVGNQTGVFLKLARRAYQGVAIVSVAAQLGTDDAVRIASAGIVVGACSAVAQRLPTLEQRLLGQSITGALATVFDPGVDLASLTPMTDAMATADYRRDAAATLVRRALQTLRQSAR